MSYDRADGYDKKFKTYANAVADSADTSLHKFVNEHGEDYFSCVVTETAICCSGCKGQNGNGAGDPCAYCFDGACYEEGSISKRNDDNHAFSNGKRSMIERDSPQSEEVRSFKMVNETEPCPPDYSKRGFGSDDPYESSIYWTFHDDRKDKFYADLLSETGIPKDKTILGNYNRGNDCPPVQHMGDGDDCWGTGYDYGIPIPHGYGASDVANPKDVVQKALDHSDDLSQQLSDALIALQLDGYYGDQFELVDSVSVPVLLIIDAVEDMSQVEEVAHKIDEEKKKALILGFLGAILFFVPIAGEVLGSVAELADVASILSIVSAAGDAALGVYQIVDDPSNPLLGIMSIIMAPLALGDLAQVSKAANIRRGMSDDDIVKLGGKIAGRIKIIRKVIGTCHKA